MSPVATQLDNSVFTQIQADTAVIGMPEDSSVQLAKSLLSRGKDVILLGSNSNLDISIRAERSLKKLAARKHRWVLTPHGFAHQFRPGHLGLVGTAGTAVQHAVCFLHGRKIGFSRIFTVGARDLSSDIGGITTFRALHWLDQDKNTEAVLLLLKPVAERLRPVLVDRLAAIGKPIVVYVFGDNDAPRGPGMGHVTWAVTLADAISASESLLKGTPRGMPNHAPELEQATNHAFRPGRRKTRIYGLFSGGSCCDECVSVLVRSGLKVVSNSALATDRPSNWWHPSGHMCLDLGAPLRTQSEPHYPMIDLSRKLELLKKVARRSKNSVVVFDVFLGLGAHPEPGRAIVKAIREAKRLAKVSKNRIVFVGTIIGVESDPQGLSQQAVALRNAGVFLTDTITSAARRAFSLVMGLA